MSRCSDRNCSICYPREKITKEQSRQSKQDCIDTWRFLQKKAEAIAAGADPIARNRRINAAYAKLWIDDRRFQWAGLTAFASKQVGCGLLNAAQMTNRAVAERMFATHYSTRASQLATNPANAPLLAVGAYDQAAGVGADRVYEMLAKGNATLFLDIWPVHMFYKKLGLARLDECLQERSALENSVYWPAGKKVRFGVARREVIDGFAAIDAGRITEGVRFLARHEQLNILQPVMYDDPLFSSLMRADQLAWALHFPSGSIQEIQLVLTSRCTADGSPALRESFSNRAMANLADPTQRMAFVMRAADRFDRLLRDPVERHMVENALYIIAAGGP